MMLLELTTTQLGFKENHVDGVEYVEFDIRKYKGLFTWGKFDVVFHLALARIQPSFEKPIESFTVNFKMVH